MSPDPATTTADPGWRNRIVGYEDADVQTLIDNPHNWRSHPQHQLDALGGALKEIGIVQNVLLNRTTGHLVDGHARVLLARRDGQRRVPTTIVALSEAEEALVLATLDPIGALAGTQERAYAELLAGLDVADTHLAAFLADQRELGGDLAAILADPGTDAHYAPNPMADAVAAGDTYAAHRLLQILCDDATYTEVVEAVKALGASYGTTTLTDTIVEAIRRARAALADPD